QVWGFEVSGSSLGHLGTRRLAALRSHGVNTLVVLRSRISNRKLAVLEERAARWNMSVLVAFTRHDSASHFTAACRLLPDQLAPTTCGLLATSPKSAASLMVTRAADIIIVRLRRPVQTLMFNNLPGIRTVALTSLPPRNLQRPVWKVA